MEKLQELLDCEYINVVFLARTAQMLQEEGRGIVAGVVYHGAVRLLTVQRELLDARRTIAEMEKENVD